MRGLPSQNALISAQIVLWCIEAQLLPQMFPRYEHPVLVKLDGWHRTGLESLVNITVQSTTSSGCRQLSQLETAVLVSAGSFSWIFSAYEFGLSRIDRWTTVSYSLKSGSSP